MRIRELRAEARDALKGNLMKVALGLFCSTVIPYLFIFVGTMLCAFLTTIHWIAMLIGMIALIVVGVYLTVYLTYGVTVSVIKVSRNEESHYFRDTFCKENRKLATAAFGGLLGKVLLWFLLAMLAPIIPVVGAFISFAAIIMCVVQVYRYMLINYLKYDYPDKPVKELLEKSRMMMHGNKAKALVIPITLIGWSLLGVAASVGISFLLNAIWPPQTIYFTTVSTVPIWATLLSNCLIYFLSSLLAAYLNMINYQLYMEQKPLEVYNDDYLKPETNASKYIWIIVGVVVAYLVLVIGCAAILQMSAMSIINSLSM